VRALWKRRRDPDPALYGAFQEVRIMASPAHTTVTLTRDQLIRALDRLQADGRWTAEHATALLDELDRSTPMVPPPGPGPETPSSLGNRLAEAAGYAGAVLIGAAGAVLAGQHWADLGRSGRVAVLTGVTVVLAAVGLAVAFVGPGGVTAVRRPQQAVRRRLASTALTIAAATGAGAVGVLASDHEFLLAAGTAVLVLVGVQWVAPSAVSETAGLGALALFAIAVLEETDASATAALVTMAAVGLVWAALSWAGVFTLPTLGLALGLGLALYAGGISAFAGGQPEEGAGIAVLCLLVAGGLSGYVRSGRWPLAAAAALALGLLVLRLTSDTLGAPVALLLTGLVLLGFGALMLVRRRTAAAPQ
jgi:hypothetical protein